MGDRLPPSLMNWVFEEEYGWSVWIHDGDYDDWTKIANLEKTVIDTFLDTAHDMGLDFVVQYQDGSTEYHLLVKE